MSAASPIRVGVAGAAGRVGRAICDGVEAADDLVLAGRADPALDTPLSSILDGCDVVVDFTRPDVALGNAIACVEAGVHVVVGTTGFDVEPLRERRGPGNAFVAPNFAIGAVLMMRFAVEASKHMAKAEIIELHHDAKLDAPSGTAKRTAELMEGDVPVHSVRLPGLVAHHEVILGDVGQTLTIRHDSTDRTSFVPGVLLACRRVGDQGAPLVVGLEAFLFGPEA
ncbi:MAG TPA: dihydrodipicolinate reductase C-terminal domain-containing protein [Baekduia sp.]|uniref:4-hydroxy-tetrahydrodipicolinate reductase n=1 Tax=Baekduia sp. TaxID=2600305 RepID=UPI002D78523B|nr:dihydrodipicolinate reductase C-terminal domain-containing protein [Baekduia sp.]HET6509243.1 dihydrodipicolinate reductase C-terminal domain-containing protein [Baekduia sp.]